MHIRSLLAGVGLAAVAVTVPVLVVSTASADTSSSASTSTPPAGQTCPRQALQSYLSAHPDVAQEVTTLRKLPQDQRAQARKAYLGAHPDVAAEFTQLRADRRGTWAEVTGQRAAELDKYPAVKALVTQLGTTPAGQRAGAARQYLADHADAKSQLQQLRADDRSQRQSCRSGG